ncbi:hypothetical protein NHQ30_005421 [Ciborinia camelliae]|nr:hypothetical protein NHQ30_005421 [Ciborinia camelliae]
MVSCELGAIATAAIVPMALNAPGTGVSLHARGASYADALGAFQYFFNILNRHAQQLKDSTRALCKLAEQSSQGNKSEVEDLMPKSALLPGLGMGTRHRTSETESIKNLESSSSYGAFTTKGLLEDYEQLYIRCINLSKMCARGTTLAMNKPTIEESRKAIQQSERLKKLTMLATLFIPLNFSSSLFGMNIDILGQGTGGGIFDASLPVTRTVLLGEFNHPLQFFNEMALWKQLHPIFLLADQIGTEESKKGLHEWTVFA